MSSIKTVKINDISIDAAIFGKGDKKLLILPGLSVTKVTPLAEAIERQYAVFAEDYTVYLFDRPDNPPEDYSVKNIAEDTAAAAVQLGAERFSVFGVSQGGMIGLYIASLYGERVEKLCVASSLYKPNKTIVEITRGWIGYAESGKTELLANDFAERVYSQETLKAYGGALRNAYKGYTADDLKRFIVYARAITEMKQIPLDIKCPTFVLGGKLDSVTTFAATKELAERLNCRRFYYEGFGHAVYDEATDFTNRVFEFFSEN